MSAMRDLEFLYCRLGTNNVLTACFVLAGIGKADQGASSQEAEGCRAG